jgi:hypothetical protein
VGDVTYIDGGVTAPVALMMVKHAREGGRQGKSCHPIVLLFRVGHVKGGSDIEEKKKRGWGEDDRTIQ